MERFPAQGIYALPGLLKSRSGGETGVAVLSTMAGAQTTAIVPERTAHGV